jgi:hypothetical protein
LFQHDFYSERINILWCECVREGHIDEVILRDCLIACLNLICARTCFIRHKFGESTLSLFISIQIYFLIFFVLRLWKSVVCWLSLIEWNITQLMLEIWLTIGDKHFKIEGILLIQWIWNVAWNFKLSKMSYGFEYVIVFWKGTKRRQFCVLNSHRKQLKIKICR